jgi:alkylhydroperoxidase/carboxymuconolactone decarboxylase family protein YurZ
VTARPESLGYPYEAELESTFPALHDAQNEWLSAIDSLTAPDRKTHHLVRLACVVILRNEPGIERHARLAREVGATWPEIVGTLLLTQPGFGVQPAVHALPFARRGFDSAEPAETE